MKLLMILLLALATAYRLVLSIVQHRSASNPIPENVAVYDKLFQEYKILHDYFGRGANDVMKRIKEIKKQAR